MQISKMNTAPINATPSDTKLIATESQSLSFSALMQGIIDNQTIVSQETATQKQSDSSCDCDKGKKLCKYDSDKEMQDVTEAKKTGIAACMECPNRTNGQCDLWNGEEGDSISNLFSAISNHAAQSGTAKVLVMQTRFDTVAKTLSELDYTNAYTYLRRKSKSVNFE